MDHEVYLDNNATTPIDGSVAEAIHPFLTNEYGNPSSVHHRGIKAEQAINQQRRTIASRLNVDPSQIFFTSGGTEANNLVISGAVRPHSSQPQHLIITEIEHSSVRDLVHTLQQKGVEVTYIKPDKRGRIDPQKILDEIRDHTRLVSVMHVNNETGVILPVEKIGRLIKQQYPDIPVHVDGVQAFAKYPVELSSIDAYTISGHKIHGPKGVGALYLSNSFNPEPLIVGGGQERGMRSGTENVPGIVGLGAATRIMFEKREVYMKHISNLRKLLVNGISALELSHLNSPLEESLPTTLNCAFPPIPGEVVVNGLSEEGVYISSGSACASGKQTNSHVLEAMELPEKYINSSVRFSISRMNTEEDIKKAVDVLKDLLPRLETVARRKK